jgi:hypothetical protein
VLGLVAVLGFAAPLAPSGGAVASGMGILRTAPALPPVRRLQPYQSSPINPIVLSTVTLSAAQTDPASCPAPAPSAPSFPNTLHAIFWTAVFTQFIGQHFVANEWLSPSGKLYSEGISETHPGQAGPITDCGGLLIVGYHDQEIGHWTFSLVVDSQVMATIPFTLTRAAPTATPTIVVPTRTVKRCKHVYRRVHGKRRKVKVCHLVKVKAKPTPPTPTPMPMPTATKGATTLTSVTSATDSVRPEPKAVERSSLEAKP